MKLKLLLLAACLALLTGCATNRGIVDLSTTTENSDLIEVSAAAPTVRITDIVDQRIFEIKPSSPSTPSLKGGEIDDRTITSRAIARKRNTYGMALGDILLPEGQTVMDVVRETISSSLAEKGYRVTSEADADYTLNASIQRFWSWFTPGFWALKIEFDSMIAINGDLPGLEDAQIKGYSHQKHQAATGGAWLQTMGVGMEDLKANLNSEIKPPE